MTAAILSFLLFAVKESRKRALDTELTTQIINLRLILEVDGSTVTYL